MSFFDEIGLRAAESLEQSVGPFVALASYKRLFAGPPEIRSKAAVGALRCALALDDENEIATVCQTWRIAREAPISATPVACELLRRSKPRLAMMVASAEEERSGTARASYVRLRAEEQMGGPPAPWRADAWRQVALRARAAGDEAVATHATARLLGLLFERASADPATTLSRAEMVSLGEAAKLELARPVEQLAILRARLYSTNRYHRASALSGLEELARRTDGAERLEAVLIAARHFSALFARLDAIEIDRIAATLKHWPDERVQKLLLAQLPAWVRLLAAVKRASPDGEPRLAQALEDLAARSAEVARGLAVARAAEAAGEPPSRPLGASADEALAWMGVDASTALARGDASATERLLQQAATTLSPDVALPPALWIAAHRALLRGAPTVRLAAATLVDRALGRTPSMPHRPLVDIAIALSGAGFSEASTRALDEAGRWREPGAGALLADEKRRGAYAAFAKGDRAAALSLLRASRDWLAGREKSP